jgi:hypothetical protein
MSGPSTQTSAYNALATFGRFEIVLGAVMGVTVALIIICIGIFLVPKKAKLVFVGLGALIGAASIGIADYALKSQSLSALEGGIGAAETLLLVV